MTRYEYLINDNDIHYLISGITQLLGVLAYCYRPTMCNANAFSLTDYTACVNGNKILNYISDVTKKGTFILFYHLAINVIEKEIFSVG